MWRRRTSQQASQCKAARRAVSTSSVRQKSACQRQPSLAAAFFRACEFEQRNKRALHIRKRIKSSQLPVRPPIAEDDGRILSLFHEG